MPSSLRVLILYQIEGPPLSKDYTPSCRRKAAARGNRGIPLKAYRVSDKSGSLLLRPTNVRICVSQVLRPKALASRYSWECTANSSYRCSSVFKSQCSRQACIKCARLSHQDSHLFNYPHSLPLHDNVERFPPDKVLEMVVDFQTPLQADAFGLL